MSDSLRPHGLQHTRPPCPSPTPGVCSNSCPLSWWCHPTISCSVVPFSSCLQSFLASESFQMSQFLTSGGQSIGSFSFNIRPSNEHPGLISFRMDWLDLLAVQGTLNNFVSLLLTETYKLLIMVIKMAVTCYHFQGLCLFFFRESMWFIWIFYRCRCLNTLIECIHYNPTISN